MFRVHHGLADAHNAPTASSAAALAQMMLLTGRLNVLITAEDLVVTGRADYNDKRDDGRIGTLVLEIPIMK